MKKISFLFCMISLLLFSCSQNRKNDKSQLIEIYIDLANDVKNYDIVDDVDPEFDFVALETNDSCLLGYISNIIFQNDRYYIQDFASTAIYIFDSKGNYISKLNRMGSGPDEYTKIGQFVVYGNTIWISDPNRSKLICYDENFNKIDEISIEKITPFDMEISGNKIYLGTNWLGFGPENYQLGEYNIENKELKYLFPFKAENPNHLIFAKESQFAVSKDTCLFVCSYCDTIFQVKDGMVEPKYKFTFSERYEDKRMTQEEFDRRDENNMQGIYSIAQTPNSIILGFTDRSCIKAAIWNKHDGTCKVSSLAFINSALGNLEMVRTFYMNTPEIIVVYDEPQSLIVNENQNVYDGSKFKNELLKQKIENVISKLKEDDNPVIFKYKLKENS